MIETWNTGGDVLQLRQQLARLGPQLAAHAHEVVITHHAIPADVREELVEPISAPITWLALPADAGYYEHKNRGFDATTGDIVAFIDGDCEPSPAWLAALIAPLVAQTQGGSVGSDAAVQVVAGATSYAGELAALANQLDFPYFDGEDAHKRRSFGATSQDWTPTVRNFFANNVAFARELFAQRRYPTIEPMFHGQCQVLALQLVTERIPIAYAPDARVTHAWPGSPIEWLKTRLLRGADMKQLLPYVLETYAPRARRPIERLGALPTLALLGVRAVTATRMATRLAMRGGPVLRSLALVAGVTAVDALGAAAAPAVYRFVAPRVSGTAPPASRLVDDEP